MLRDTILDWYVFMSSLSVQLTTDVLLLDQRVGIPLISALLLGFIGAAAPCQLTQSVGMVAVLGQTTAGRPRWRATLAYLAGKALVYTSLGVLAVVVGASLSELSIPVFVAARKVLGPLMIVVGLGMIGALRFTWVPGHPVALRLRQTLRHRAQGAPFLLGVAFGFAFCPTLFALFFGFLIPLALSRPDGVLYPALFALGTALPLLTILGLLTFAGGSLRRYARQIGRGQQVVAVLAGALLVIAGLHDTVLYWLI
ncbi:MAG: sulfite exporter TauE/SafE family protein [Rhizobiales bacterium]|nr:sulfite exporter TauE/SafE family protein [Hyphomicrobiales bacterium]